MSSENPIIKDSRQMITLLQKALAEPVGSDLNDIDDEHLALLAEGRLNTLPPSQRINLLNRIAAVPEAAALLAELRDLDLGQRQAKSVQVKTLHWTRVCWAIAACLMIGLFVSRWMVPTPHVSPQGQIMPYQAPGQPDYWNQLDQQRLQQQSHWTHYRDIALVVSTVTCLVLSIGLVLVVGRRKPRS